MTIKKTGASIVFEPSAGTRRDVMKLSIAVAAFGAAMGISGPGAAQTSRKNKDLRGGATEGKVKGKVKTSGDRQQTKHKDGLGVSPARSQTRIKHSGR